MEQLQQQLAAQARLMEQMQQQMQQLMAAQQQTANEATTAKVEAEAAGLAQAAATAVPGGGTAAQPSAASTGAPTIDTRLIGKPDNFDGQKGWKDWSVVMRSYMSALNPNASNYMRNAEQSTTPELNATLSHEQTKFSTQLFYILVIMCKERALDKVVNAGRSEGLEAWKQLVVHHEPGTTTRHAGMLLELLSFSFEGDTLSRLEAFERDIHRYTQSSGDDFSDNIRLGVALRNLPKGPLREYLILNADRFKTWTAVQDEIANVVRAQATAQSKPAPMDLDAMMHNIQSQLSALSKGKGKGKAGGKNNNNSYAGGNSTKDKNAPKTPCPICGKAHWKRDC